MRLPSLSVLLENAISTFKRFPFVLFAAMIASAAFIRIINFNIETSMNFHPHWFQLLMSASLGIPLMFGLTIMSESLKWKGFKYYLLIFSGIIILFLYYLSIGDKENAIDGGRYLLYSAAFHLFAAFSGFVFSKDFKIIHFWDFNQKIFLRIILSGLYTGVLYAGLAIALLAFDNLFEIHIQVKRYFQLFILLAGIFNTWFFCSGVPDLDELREKGFSYLKGLKIFAQYVLLPIVVIYIIILYLYLFKIVFLWSLPIGWVSWLVLGFSVAGIFSLLLVYPLKEEIKWIRIFSKWFFVALIPQISLLFAAIFKRSTEYGITERRYYVIVLAFWLTFITIYYIITNFRNIKVIPISLFLIAIITSGGWWGTFSLSIRSQVARMQEIIEKNGLRVENKFLSTPKEIPDDERKDLYSIINYLIVRDKLSEIQPLFSEDLANISEEKPTGKLRMNVYEHKEDKIVRQMGVLPYSEKSSNDRESFTLSTKENVLWETGNFDKIIKFNYSIYDTGSHRIDDDIMIKGDTASNSITFNIKSNEMKFDLDTVIKNVKTDLVPPEQMMIRNDKGMLMIYSLSASKMNGRMMVTNLNGQLTIKN